MRLRLVHAHACPSVAPHWISFTETVNLTQFCSMLNNESFKFLALTLDAQTQKITIKLRITANKKTHEGL